MRDKIFFLACVLITWNHASADFSLPIELEGRYFDGSESILNSGRVSESIAIEPDWQWEPGDKVDWVRVKLFARWDSEDNHRSDFEVRELTAHKVLDGSEHLVGVSKVFWGVTESQHLVDIINQSDLVESPTAEVKLSQLMYRGTMYLERGFVEVYLLPGFRERRYPSYAGSDHLNLSDLPATFESGSGEDHVDVAVRWFGSGEGFDLALSYFRGTSREPLLEQDSHQNVVLFYPQISQVGLEGLMARSNWLWKLEAIYNRSKSDQFAAVTSGFEYTLAQAFGSTTDIGLVFEYTEDTRDKGYVSADPMNMFWGVRLTANNVQSSELLMGYYLDSTDSDRQAFMLEGSTRFSDDLKLTLNWYAYDEEASRVDHIVELKLVKYF